MKNLLLFAIMMFSIMSFAQTPTKIDSLNRSLVEQTRRIDGIQLNLTKFHSQYNDGLGWLFVGVVGTGLGYGAYLGGTPEGGVFIIGLSSIITIVGAFEIIDSHKFIGRAGNTRK